MMNLKIRAMQEVDINKVYDIERTAHITPWSKEIIRECFKIGYDCRVLEHCHRKMHTIIGYIISRPHHHDYHILNLCITKSMQSKGLGTEFLTRVLKSLETNKSIASITLEVRMNNAAALKLYHHLGFVQVQIKENYYKDQDKNEHAIVLKKEIQKF